MNIHGIWVFIFVVGTSLVVFTFSSSSSVPALTAVVMGGKLVGFGLTLNDFLNVIPGMEFLQRVDGRSLIGTSRKLKGSGYNPSNEKNNVDVEDYDPVDPVPSSKASVKPGPIEHGSPLIPYIPKPSPPDHPKIGGSA